MDLSALLFTRPHNPKLTCIRGELSVLNVGYGGLTGKARPASASGSAKINNGAVAIDLICEQRLNGLWDAENKALYIEFRIPKTETLYRANVVGFAKERYSFCGEAPHEAAYVQVPLFIYALCAEYFANTREEFKVISDNIISNSGKVTDFDALYRLCDDYYYEGIKIFDSQINIDQGIAPSDEEIKQMLRRGNYTPVQILSDLEDYLMPFSVEIAQKASESAEKSVAKADAEKFKTAKMGGYQTDYVFDLETRSKIPTLESLETFIPTTQFYTMLDLTYYNQSQVYDRMQDPAIGYSVDAIGDDYTNILISGRPGTGKTTVAYALAAALGMPISLVGSSKNAEEDIFQGMTKVSEGGFKFFETAFLERYEHGGIALVDDINRCPAGITALLLDAIEKPFILMKDGYKEIRRHPMFTFIATMNVGTQGTVEPNEALISRMTCAVVLNDPDKDDFLKVLAERSQMPMNDCKKVFKAYSKILEYLKSPRINAEDVALTMTLRQCIGALKLIRLGRPFKESICNTMIGVIASKDVDLSQNVYDNVVAVMPD